MTWVAGVDGCPAGWIVIIAETDLARVRYKVVDHISAVAGLSEDPKIVAIDIPIGLLDSAVPGGRKCDQLARALLRRPRASSVFSPPVRGALIQEDYPKALHANRESSASKLGISKQCFGLFEKMRHVDDWLASADTSQPVGRQCAS
jgi:predicted RNase H-like nuclease